MSCLSLMAVFLLAGDEAAARDGVTSSAEGVNDHQTQLICPCVATVLFLF
jgi:hypothetical protein